MVPFHYGRAVSLGTRLPKANNAFYSFGDLGRVNTNGRTVYQGRYLLAWKSRPSSSHVLNIAFPPNAATSA